jgi:hypothetical protein
MKISLMILFSAIFAFFRAYAEEKIMGGFGYNLGEVIPLENLSDPPSKEKPYPTSSSATDWFDLENERKFGFKFNKHFTSYIVNFSPKTRVINRIQATWDEKNWYYNDGPPSSRIYPARISVELFESKVQTLLKYLEGKYGTYITNEYGPVTATHEWGKLKSSGFMDFDARQIKLYVNQKGFDGKTITIVYTCPDSEKLVDKERKELAKENAPKESDFKGL